MSMLEKLVVGLALALGSSVAGAADAPRFGQPIAPNDLAPWDISIGPDGGDLPLGSGTPSQGAAVYAAHAAARPAMARRVAAARAVRWSAVVRSIPPIAIR
jgi:hypothetical protein